MNRRDVPDSIRRTDAYRRVLDVGTVFLDAWLELLSGLPEGAPVPIEGTVLLDLYVNLKLKRELEADDQLLADREQLRKRNPFREPSPALVRDLTARWSGLRVGPLPKEPERHHDAGSGKAAEGEGGESEDAREGGEGNGPA